MLVEADEFDLGDSLDTSAKPKASDELFSLEEGTPEVELRIKSAKPPKYVKGWEKSRVKLIQNNLVRLLIIKSGQKVRQGRLDDLTNALLGTKNGPDGRWKSKTHGLWLNAMQGKGLPADTEQALIMMKKDLEVYKVQKKQADQEAEWENADITTPGGFHLRRQRAVYNLLKSKKAQGKTSPDQRKQHLQNPPPVQQGQSFKKWIGGRGLSLYNVYSTGENPIVGQDEYVKMRLDGALKLGTFAVEYAAGLAGNAEPGTYDAATNRIQQAVRITFDGAADTIYIEIPDAMAMAVANKLIVIPDPNTCATEGSQVATALEEDVSRMATGLTGLDLKKPKKKGSAVSPEAKVAQTRAELAKQTGVAISDEEAEKMGAELIGDETAGISCQKMQELINAHGKGGANAVAVALIKYMHKKGSIPTKFKVEGCVYVPQTDKIGMPEGSFFPKNTMNQRLGGWKMEQKRQDTVKKGEEENEWQKVKNVADAVYNFWMAKGGDDPIFNPAAGFWGDKENKAKSIWKAKFDSDHGATIRKLKNKKWKSKLNKLRDETTKRVGVNKTLTFTINGPDGDQWSNTIPGNQFKMGWW